MRVIICAFLILTLTACSTDLAEVNAITDNTIFKIEEATDVVILYSDSADVKVRITAHKMIRHMEKINPRDEFPDGIFVEFLGKNGRVYSWLEADRATRYDKKNEVVAQGNARFYNTKKETLTSPELIWDEDKSIIKTNKFVRITQPMKGDTTYGSGFRSNEEFNLFEILKKTSGVFNMQGFKANMEAAKK